MVHLDQTHQTIEGFGVNDTWGSGSIPASEFSATSGIGLSILRVGMNETGGFMSGNIQADINTVKGISGTKIIGSCWSPPTSCKTSGSLNTGHLTATTSCMNSWATTVTNFAKSNGLYAMSVANEPDFESRPAGEPFTGAYPTTLYTANEMVAWVKVVGPMLQQAGVKVISPEPSEWNHLWSNTSACCSVPSGKNSEDPFMCGFPPSNTACTTGSGYDYGHFLAKDATAWAAFDIIGTHEYDSQQAYAWPSDVTAARKEVWETEMSGVKWWAEQGPSCDIADGIVVAKWIHSALVVGDASAWVWWWYDGGSSASGTNENLVNVSGCSGGTTDPKRHYTLGNFSKFVRPGYVRVDVSGSPPSGVSLSAYKDSAGTTVVIVAINSNSSAATVPVSITGGSAPTQCTPTVTSATQNLTAQSAASLSSGLALAASTVTTFVCK